VNRRRLDAELVRRGLASSRSEARDAVSAGLILLAGTTARNASTMVDADAPLTFTGQPRRFVSRGGDKLRAALDRFPVDPKGLDALDAGSSTGGFTDCLVRAGAARVVAVDVGYGQLDWGLRNDARVTVMERTNIRDLLPDGLPFPPDLLVADLSFISLSAVAPALVALGRERASFIALVKPQFEADRQDVGRGGVVRDPEVWRRALGSVAAAFDTAGAAPRAAMASPLTGPAGNVEFLLWAVRGSAAAELDLDAVVQEGREVAGG
jgi:23S rRNA (cytidine1920-2'-O)/16S rRNA (cytidine1409-2'-O)-methyltransferase